MNANLANPTTKTTNPVKVNWWVDLTLFAAILLSLAPNFTGLTIHEWLGLSLGVGIGLHLLLHWQWIVSVLKRFFSRIPLATRINLFLNMALFITIVVVIFTGLLISREALPLLGLTISGGHQWESIHKLSTDVLLWFSAAHVALHWKWILNSIRRYLVDPLLKLGRRPAKPELIYKSSEVK